MLPQTNKKIIIGDYEIEYEHRSPECFLGRFGGGWQWELGFQLGGHSLLINLLVSSVRISKIRPLKLTPTIDMLIESQKTQKRV